MIKNKSILLVIVGAFTFFAFSAFGSNYTRDMERSQEVAKVLEELRQELAQDKKDREEELKQYWQALVQNKNRKKRKQKSIGRGIAGQ